MKYIFTAMSIQSRPTDPIIHNIIIFAHNKDN